jgi:hypothetical protein
MESGSDQIINRFKRGNRMRSPITCLWLAAILGFGFVSTATAEEQKSADDIARELSNPTNAMAGMGINIDFQSFDGDLPGAGDQNGFTLLFQPSLPFPQGNGYNLLVRPAIPVVFQAPVPDGMGGFRNEGVALGNIGFDVAYGTTYKSGVLFLFGVVGELPTNTNDAVGADQWRLGPEVAIGLVKKWGVIGLLATHKVDVAGDDDPDTSITGGQYFYAFTLPKGWQIAAGPSWSYDNNADSGNKLTLPLGIGFSKTTVTAKGTPLKFGMQYWKYVESPDTFGPDWQIRFNFTPVLKVPWG